MKKNMIMTILQIMSKNRFNNKISKQINELNDKLVHLANYKIIGGNIYGNHYKFNIL